MSGLRPLEIAAGLNFGTTAPYFSEIFAIFALSVDTTTSLIRLQSKAQLIEYDTNGCPFRFKIFLLGSLSLPDLAGIKATNLPMICTRN
jgi:hypothetical protein